MKLLRLLVATTVCVLCLISRQALADDENVPAKQLFSGTQTISGQSITVTPNPKVQVILLTIPPGVKLPVHKHPYIRYCYVQKGQLDVTVVDQNKVSHLNTGDFFAEVVNTWHYGTNNGTEPAELLVIDQIPQDAVDNTIKKKD